MGHSSETGAQGRVRGAQLVQCFPFHTLREPEGVLEGLGLEPRHVRIAGSTTSEIESEKGSGGMGRSTYKEELLTTLKQARKQE